jgi:hypothetical protein
MESVRVGGQVGVFGGIVEETGEVLVAGGGHQIRVGAAPVGHGKPRPGGGQGAATRMSARDIRASVPGLVWVTLEG